MKGILVESKDYEQLVVGVTRRLLRLHSDSFPFPKIKFVDPPSAASLPHATGAPPVFHAAAVAASLPHAAAAPPAFHAVAVAVSLPHAAAAPPASHVATGLQRIKKVPPQLVVRSYLQSNNWLLILNGI
ncbi:hypothetical protein ACS0TY_001772 [Phlomoides rotata]